MTDKQDELRLRGAKCTQCGHVYELHKTDFASGRVVCPPVPREEPWNFDDLCTACDELPDDWHVAIIATRQGLEVTLTDPKAVPVDCSKMIRGFDDEENCTVKRQVELAIDYARRKDGLQNVFD